MAEQHAAAAASRVAPPPMAAAPPGSELTAELKAQFNHQITVTAIRVSKQQTTHYMKLMSK
jgi:hypothetical protein